MQTVCDAFVCAIRLWFGQMISDMVERCFPNMPEIRLLEKRKFGSCVHLVDVVQCKYKITSR